MPPPSASAATDVLTPQRVDTQKRKRSAERRRWARRAVEAFVGLAIVVSLVVAAWPKPVLVEVAAVRRGLLRVTVSEPGRTRVRDRFVVSAPLAGDLARMDLHAGDAVEKGSPLARIVPMSPALLDPRARSEAQARVAGAEAAASQTRASVARAELAAAHARDDLDRAKRLAATGSISAEAGRDAELESRLREQELASAKFAQEMANHDVDMARAALGRFGDAARGRDVFEVPAPASGRVLRVQHESAGIVQPGTPLVELGDAAALEVVVDVLTEDAVGIGPHASVALERWGGPEALAAHVRVVEPSAFTRISALGVEEQRVSVVVDFDDPRDKWAALGDGYRVEANIVVWQEPDVIAVPSSAVFRGADGWAAFVEDGGRARLRTVDIGQRSSTETQILRGVNEGEKVIVHPSDAVTDGVRVTLR